MADTEASAVGGSSLSEADTPKASPAATFRRWLHEEKFWQDVTTRLLAAVLATPLVALAAAAYGLLKLNIPLVLLSVCLFFHLGFTGVAAGLEATPANRRKRRALIAISGSLGILTLWLTWYLLYGDE